MPGQRLLPPIAGNLRRPHDALITRRKTASLPALTFPADEIFSRSREKPCKLFNHFSDFLLETVTEEAERDTIRKLLAEAEAKLRRLNETPK